MREKDFSGPIQRLLMKQQALGHLHQPAVLAKKAEHPFDQHRDRPAPPHHFFEARRRKELFAKQRFDRLQQLGVLIAKRAAMRRQGQPPVPLDQPALAFHAAQ